MIYSHLHETYTAGCHRCELALDAALEDSAAHSAAMIVAALQAHGWSEQATYAAFVDAALDPPAEAGAATLLSTQHCGLCDSVIPARQVAWFDNVEEGGFSHVVCWVAELADTADPYRFHAVRRSDF